MSEVKRYDIGGMPGGGIDVQQFHDGYWVKHSDYAALQQKLDSLAAENAALKEVGKSCTQHWAAAENGSMVRLMDKCIPKLRDALNKTPATDAYLNSVRAEGVDYVAEAIGAKCAELKVGSIDWKALKSVVFMLVSFAAQLRSQEAK